MNQISPQERRALRKRYAPEKKIKHWEVVDMGIVVFRNASPALCEHFIKQNNLTKAFKKPIYENK